ncbi:MAG: hypothetical protein HZA53_08495 [Planctomycetes bacterium]|nr:hypothetical protein [Planctomycetota bacterium]
MRQLRSDFEPGLIGCDSFRGFVQRAASEGAVLLDPRTLLPGDEERLVAAFRAVLSGS